MLVSHGMRVNNCPVLEQGQEKDVLLTTPPLKQNVVMIQKLKKKILLESVSEVCETMCSY